MTSPDQAKQSAHDQPGARRTLVAALVGTTALVTAASYLSPADYAATAVGGVFLLSTYLLVLRHDEAMIRAHGLALGGLLLPQPLEWRRLLREAGGALLLALLAFALVVLPFAIGYARYTGAKHGFQAARAWPSFDDVLGQLLVIALPEEAFFRGYVQSQLDRIFPRQVRVLGLPLSASIVLTSAVFALGHFLTVPSPERLAVFFPSLLFGALRARSGGIGASIVFHALCNLLSQSLSRGYFG